MISWSWKHPNTALPRRARTILEGCLGWWHPTTLCSADFGVFSWISATKQPKIARPRHARRLLASFPGIDSCQFGGVFLDLGSKTALRLPQLSVFSLIFAAKRSPAEVGQAPIEVSKGKLHVNAWNVIAFRRSPYGFPMATAQIHHLPEIKTF